MPGASDRQHVLKLAELPAGRDHAFVLEPDAGARASIAEGLGLRALRKLRFSGHLAPLGARDWQLRATLGATVVQDCVVTLEPVTTRIDEPVARSFLAELPELPEAEEVEMPEDDSLEPLPEALNLAEIMTEALALSLPPYPRAEGAEMEEANFTQPGQRPMTDDDAKPFAGLAALREKLGDTDDKA